ncbi:MAG: metallophosphoesterase [Desulfobacterales bacterium]|nr:metallophosphoesterase [Desulfobacterales bacterium]
MKILTVSDRVEPSLYKRFDPEKFQGVDLILSCGDLPPEYLTFLTVSLEAPLYYVRGNHDIRYASSPPDGCMNLHGRLVQFQSIRILGLEGSRWYNGGPCQHHEHEMKRMIKRLRFRLWRSKGVDIVITHAPPRRVHDAEDPCHKGFKSFNRFIDKYAPMYFIHGHIHKLFNDPSRRITIVNETSVINSYGFFLLEIGGDRHVR